MISNIEYNIEYNINYEYLDEICQNEPIFSIFIMSNNICKYILIYIYMCIYFLTEINEIYIIC